MDIFSGFMAEKGQKKKASQAAKNEIKEEYSEEFLASSDLYAKNGVLLQRKAGSTVKILYNGLLAKSGATDVYTVVGFGSNGKWNDIATYKMNKVGPATFEVDIPVSKKERINVAFKDGADHWDNNSGQNYSFIQ